jgi:polyphosphate kinase 2 (PPK2 family)
MDKHAYKHELHALQKALVDWQAGAMKSGQRVVIVLEGRDTAGKDGAIKRIIEHLSVRATRAVALPKPSDRERGEWYFQRYVAYLPSAGEVTIFNRSWYNRAGVERVMLLKYWLDISKGEQAKRLESRRTDPLKALKVSDLDGVAQEKWKAYSKARNTMLEHTHTDLAPWWCIATDHKKAARINLMRHLVRHLVGEDAAEAPKHDVLFRYEPEALSDGRLAK